MGMCSHIDTVTCPSCESLKKLKEVCNIILDDSIKPGNVIPITPMPYRCPVCEGEGRIVIKDSNEMLLSMPPQKPTKQCNGCEGKGIVWG
jgi:hypothetical protein